MAITYQPGGPWLPATSPWQRSRGKDPGQTWCRPLQTAVGREKPETSIICERDQPGGDAYGEPVREPGLRTFERAWWG
jgi:hypothetical protein